MHITNGSYTDISVIGTTCGWSNLSHVLSSRKLQEGNEF